MRVRHASAILLATLALAAAVFFVLTRPPRRVPPPSPPAEIAPAPSAPEPGAGAEAAPAETTAAALPAPEARAEAAPPETTAVTPPAPPAPAPVEAEVEEPIARPPAAPPAAAALPEIALPDSGWIPIAPRPALAADTIATAPAELPASSAMGPLVIPATQDTYGLLAAWAASHRDTAAVRPLAYWATLEPDRDALLNRIRRRSASRAFVRERLGLRPGFFTEGDSIALQADARSDSLEQAGVAPGVLVRFAPRGGLRLVPPEVRSLSRSEPLKRQVAVDLGQRRVRRALLRQAQEVSLWPSESYAEYLARLSRVRVRRVWKEEIARSMKAATVKGGRAGLLRVALPFELPKAVRSIFGEGKPNLSVRGSERITFGGRSTWFPFLTTSESQRKPSKFPQLEMEQELNIQLKGTIGDKLDVDVDQSSQAATPLANRIKIHYKGYEDEIIKRIDLGNTTLSLPGTEYVTLGGQRTGLFGINGEGQFGDVTLNLIMSKEEGETGQATMTERSEEVNKRIPDYEYVKDRFFFLDDPTRPAYGDPDSFVVQLDPQSVRVYLDDGTGGTGDLQIARWKGRAVLDLAGPAPAPGDTVAPADSLGNVFYFQQLEYGTDYSVSVDPRNQAHPILILNRYLREKDTLGITYYDRARRRQVGTRTEDASQSSDTIYVKMIRPSTELVKANLEQGPWGPANRLMVKNVYSLHQSLEEWELQSLPEKTILEEGFDLSIHYNGSIDNVPNPDLIRSVPIIRLLGLDSYKTGDSGLQEGQDNQVDKVWIDFTNGYLFFPDLEPFAPRDGLRGRPGGSAADSLPREYWNPEIYYQRSCVRDHGLPGTATGTPEAWNSLYYLQVRYRTPQTELTIKAMDIIEGSEVVTVGGRTLARDRDYRIDYQTGKIELLPEASVRAEDEITVTYKHAGGLGVASKTLLGAAAAYRPPGSDLALSTAWVFQKRGSPDRRPRLGSEPTQIAVGEVAGRYGLESAALTRLVDRLPFLDARKPSKLSFEGRLGVSFPNPNTRNDLYLDDFEGVADDISVSLTRQAWRPTSPPAGAAGTDEASRSAHAGELWWYTPYVGTYEGDFNPTLDYQEANNQRSVLELQMWPYDPPGASAPASSWAGIVQPLSDSKLDLTRARFLDIWVNDFTSYEWASKRMGTLYVELGQVSEDALWARRAMDLATRRVAAEAGPLAPPNRTLDTEDRIRDGELDLSERNNEDTGLDQVEGLDPADGVYDDYGWDGDSQKEYAEFADLSTLYRQIDGTEGNSRLDTEDLDRDNTLDQGNNYFRFRVDLADLDRVATDVRRDYQGQQTNWTLDDNNGWRRIRIPLNDTTRVEVGDPSWSEIKHLRIWFEGFEEWQRLQIGGIDIRSNRWVAQPIQDLRGAIVPDSVLAVGEDFYPGVVSNKENADIYDPPFEEHRDRANDNVREREQSLALELRNFQPGRAGRVLSSFLESQNYSNYGALAFYLNSTLPADSGLEFFLRLCKGANTDSTDYYEYRVGVPGASWLPVSILLSDLSGLKGIAPSDTSLVRPDGSTIAIRGHPNLNVVSRITLGVRHLGSTAISEGSVWIDELRLTDVHKEIDTGYHFQVRSELADLGTVDVGYDHVGADFTTISGGGFRARRETKSSLTLNVSRVQLQRFLPAGLGVNLPFGHRFSRTRTVPKFRTDDDLLVEEHPTDRDVSEQVSRSYDLSFSRQKSQNPWTRYTLDAVTLAGSIQVDRDRQPKRRSSTVSRKLSFTYAFPFGDWGDVRFYRGWKLRLPPRSLTLSIARSENEQTRFRRVNDDLFRDWMLDYDATVRSGGLTLATTLNPIKEVTYTFNQNRDLMRRERVRWLGDLNIGRETSRQEDLNASYTLRPAPLRGWLEPRLTWRGRFGGSFGEQRTSGAGSLERTTRIDNDQTGSATMDLPVAKLLNALGNLGARREPEKEQAKDRQGATETPAGETPEEAAKEGTRQPPGEGEAAAPRTERGNPLKGILDLSRTSGSLSLTRRSAYDQVAGEPSLQYQLGLSQDPGIARREGSEESRGRGRRLGLDAEFQVMRLVSVSASVEENFSETNSTKSNTGQRDRTLPELDIRWGDLSQRLGVRKYLKSFKASSRYTRQEKRNTQGEATTRRTVTSDWAPLLDLDFALKSGTSAVLRITRRATQETSHQGPVTDNRLTQISLTAKRSLTISREITVPLRKTKERITTKLDLSLTAKYEKQGVVVRQPGREPQVSADLRKWGISMGGGYQFSRSVTGRASMEFGEDANNKNRTGTKRYIGLSVTASFSF